MKIVTGSLKQALTKVDKIKGKVLGYSIQTIDDELYLVKTLENTECRVLLDSDEVGGEIALTQKILKTLSLVKENLITIDIESNIAKTEKRKINIGNNNEVIYTYINQEEKLEEISIQADEFKILMHTVNFIATDGARPILESVNFNNSEVASLDGYRMCIRKANFKLENEYNVNGTTLKDVVKTLDKKTKNINIKFTKNYAVITIGDCIITSRLLEGNYIKYRQLIPSEFKTVVNVSVNELTEETKFLSKLQDNNKLVKIEISKDFVIKDTFNNNVNIEDVKKTGEELTIGINSEYLLDTLKCFEDKVDIEMNGNLNPLVFKSRTIDGLNLVLPVRIMR